LVGLNVTRPKVNHDPNKPKRPSRAQKKDGNQDVKTFSDRASVENTPHEMLKNKRKRKPLFDLKNIDVYESDESLDEDVKEMHRSIQNSKNSAKNDSVDGKVGNFKDDEIKAFETIDQILDKLSADFPNKAKEELLENLRSMSFNLENTYKYLQYPEENKSNI
jgi:hypothetical protein